MLSSANRLRSSGDFAAATKHGIRAKSGELVAYLLTCNAGLESSRWSPRVGLIVGKSVGNSVVRHQVSRRIRAAAAPRLEDLSPGDILVVRALAGSHLSSTTAFERDLKVALRRFQRRTAR